MNRLSQRDGSRPTTCEEKKVRRILLLTLLVVTMLGAAEPAMADHGSRWHGDIQRFHEHDYDHWRGGHWYHGWHDGRFAWWWLVGGGLWYWYPAAVYPYPDPYTPPVVIQTAPVVQPAPAAPPPAVVQAQAPAAVWYYCNHPAGYYPYVPQCPSGWTAVSAAPSGPVVAAPLPPPPSR